MTKALSLLAVVVAASITPVAVARSTAHHVNAVLVPVAGSTVTGMVQLTALPQGGTEISIAARGLLAGGAYLSLYYDNDECELEPYSADDVIGNYAGRPGGVGITVARVDDDLDEIYSVSVRRASDFALLACAKVRDEDDETLTSTRP